MRSVFAVWPAILRRKGAEGGSPMDLAGSNHLPLKIRDIEKDASILDLIVSPQFACFVRQEEFRSFHPLKF
jgi:hypothetical protein